jgi:hypothetical protein
MRFVGAPDGSFSMALMDISLGLSRYAAERMRSL